MGMFSQAMPVPAYHGYEVGDGEDVAKEDHNQMRTKIRTRVRI